jgi:hypothetical protein
VTETHTDNTSDQVVKELGKSIKDMPRSFWVLVKNPAFLFITLAGTFDGFSTSGMTTFLPKLIQNQFGISAAWAAILGGTNVVGVFFSVKQTHEHRKMISKMIFIDCFENVLFLIFE